MRFTIWDLDEVEPELVHLLKGGAEQGSVWLVMSIPLTRLVARGALELLPFCDTFCEVLNAQVDLQGASTMPRQCNSKAGMLCTQDEDKDPTGLPGSVQSPIPEIKILCQSLLPRCDSTNIVTASPDTSHPSQTRYLVFWWRLFEILRPTTFDWVCFRSVSSHFALIPCFAPWPTRAVEKT